LCLALLTSNPLGLQLAALVYENYSSLRHHELSVLACFLLAQLVHEYRVPLQAGRYLCFLADNVGLAVSMKHTIQYKQAHNSLGDMGVDLLFPGTPHTVV
jgi:hypothetical protein